MIVRVTQLDGKLPNLALMKLSHWHKERGDTVHFERSASIDLFEPIYDVIYGSAIFKFSKNKIDRFLETFPSAKVGGTGTDSLVTVEDLIGSDYEKYDYSIYPSFTPSIGFTQRGCRLSCKFCVVPGKEGKPKSVNTVHDIWRGEGHPKELHLLDNDFFGQPEDQWRARIEEMREGGFKVCFNQGINVRHITPSAAAALSTIRYMDDSFKKRRIYTAWDNLKDEKVFFNGVGMLSDAGVPPTHIRAYMLCGFFKNETFEAIMYRFERMRQIGIEPFPMVFDCRDTDPDRYRLLKRFQRWVVTGLYRFVAWEDYQKRKQEGGELLEIMAND